MAPKDNANAVRVIWSDEKAKRLKLEALRKRQRLKRAGNRSLRSATDPMVEGEEGAVVAVPESESRLGRPPEEGEVARGVHPHFARVPAEIAEVAPARHDRLASPEAPVRLAPSQATVRAQPGVFFYFNIHFFFKLGGRNEFFATCL